ncbi:hypothetical protein [Mycolicibacterium llatzerense]|uniref:hypothetical protein n=1 Tax=Mycolicibacterium llatzerense TaxID=280871 RepID=UPI0021B649C2|nr:hypothetical protein [Mycolicibacterium llatzerense]MCT7362932.1 hypothetical protein [Mycolicibacterium llatzerense]
MLIADENSRLLADLANALDTARVLLQSDSTSSARTCMTIHLWPPAISTEPVDVEMPAMEPTGHRVRLNKMWMQMNAPR